MAPDNETQRQPFTIRDCALVSIATGRRAQNLKELHDQLQTIHPGCIYYHFWGGLLRPSFDDPEYNNDFAAWARHGLHDAPLAERLGIIDPADFEDMEALRVELLDVIEERLDESEFFPWSKREQQFEFIRSQIVVFDTGRRLHDPRELVEVAPELSTSSVFYHFIDARRRPTEGIDDFQAWLRGFDDRYAELCEGLAGIDPYFLNLVELRTQLAAVFREYFAEVEGRGSSAER